MNKITNPSDIVIIATAILAATGLLGALWWKVNRSKKEKKNNSQPQQELGPKRNQRTEAAPEIKSEVCKTVPSTPPMRGSYKTAEDLVCGVSLDLINKKSFKSPQDFLEQLISRSSLAIESYSWYEEIPKTVEELEAALKKLGLFEVYSRILIEEIHY